MRRPVGEGPKPYDGHERAGEVGLRRSTDALAEQGKVTFCGGWGGKGAAGGELRCNTHAPDQCRNQHVPVFDGVRRANCSFSLSIVMILQKSRMRKRARTDLCGGRFVRIV